jgi:glutaminyl-tRNA synthetase
VVELKCTFDPETRGGNAPDGRKVKGTIHWVSADHAVKAEVRLYDRLFSVEQPGTDGVDFLTQLNPDSKKVVTGYLEPAAAQLKPGEVAQFERVGYFACDPDTTAELPVFNRTVTLKDSWSKQQKK